MQLTSLYVTRLTLNGDMTMQSSFCFITVTMLNMYLNLTASETNKSEAEVQSNNKTLETFFNNQFGVAYYKYMICMF